MSKQRVVLGMSGGVDSSVSVHLLQQQGYTVIGVHMLMIPEAFQPKPYAEQDARKVAEQYGIEFHTVEVRDAFVQQVVRYFADEYAAGRTPNPCVICNRQVKFHDLAKFADEIGAQWIATGHYAGLTQLPDGRRLLTKAADQQKDQSYFLSLLPPEILNRVIFPLGQYTKQQVRQIAAQLGLSVAAKSDSQEICFIPDNDYKQFLMEFLPAKAFQQGEICYSDGRKLGMHNGLPNYTIGQRKGLGIALGEPAYVIRLDKERNQVILGSNEQLMKSSLLADHNQFFVEVPLKQPIQIQAKVRYRAYPEEATLFRHNEQLTQVEFVRPQRAVTPGQCVCYYQQEQVIGGGIIQRVVN